MTWYQYSSGILSLKLYIQPGARQHEIVGVIHDALKIKLAAPAIEGRANTALIKFLSELLKVPKSTIQLKAGKKARYKLVEIYSGAVDLNHLLAISNKAPS